MGFQKAGDSREKRLKKGGKRLKTGGLKNYLPDNQQEAKNEKKSK